MKEIKAVRMVSNVLLITGGAAALLTLLLGMRFQIGQILREQFGRKGDMRSDRRKEKRKKEKNHKRQRIFATLLMLLPAVLLASELSAGIVSAAETHMKENSRSEEENPDGGDLTDGNAPEVSLTFEEDRPVNEKYFHRERIAHLTIKERRGGLSEEKVKEELAACITASDSQGNPVPFDADANIVFEGWEPLPDRNKPEENKEQPDSAIDEQADEEEEQTGSETREKPYEEAEEQPDSENEEQPDEEEEQPDDAGSSDGIEEGYYIVTVLFSEDAAYSWQPVVTDEAGNVSGPARADGQAAPFDFTIDRLSPELSIYAEGNGGRMMEWTALADKPGTTFFHNASIRISQAAFDATSPLDQVSYYEDQGGSLLSAEELNEVTDWKEFQSLELRPGMKTVIYAKASDLAGNTKYVSTEGILLDSQPPLADMKVQNAAGSELKIHKEDVNISLSVQDRPEEVSSGIRRVSYRVLNMGQETQKGTLLQDGDAMAWSGGFQVDSSLNNSNDICVEAEAEDRAGNVTRSRLELGIDITPPEISVSFDQNEPVNGKYYNQPRRAVILVKERNFDPALFWMNVSGAYGSVPVLSQWRKIHAGADNGDSTLYRAELLFEEDGDYRLDFSCRDQAGNESGQAVYAAGMQNPQEFVIDRTLPEIRISYDQNEPVNGKFFKNARQAEIRLRERNFDPELFQSGMKAELDGKNMDPPQITWTKSTDPELHIGKIVFEKDGDYTVDFTDTDLAGNASRKADYGKSKAAGAFTIDRTIEEASVTGVKDRTSYRDKLSLQVTFQDRHYDRAEVSLIKRERDGSMSDVSKALLEDRKETETGVSIRSRSFEVLRKNDGIYFFKCSFLDKAGNRIDSELVFSVNRFGSIYIFDDYLNALTQSGRAYVKQLKDDLVIREYNADPLLPDSLKAEITCDGKPLPMPSFAAEKQTGNRFGSWSEYRWVLSRENFRQDGLYKVMVTSGDEAGNQKDSTMDGLPEICFHVDAAPPELLSVTGMEKEEVHTAEQPVAFRVYDAQGLKQVRTFVDGEEINTDPAADEGPCYFSGNFILSAKNEPRHVRIVMEDLAGNVTDTDSADFPGLLGFEPTVLVKADPLTRAAMRAFRGSEYNREKEENRIETAETEGAEVKEKEGEGAEQMEKPHPDFTLRVKALLPLLICAAAAAFSALIQIRKKIKKAEGKEKRRKR
ncbi:MAG: hypothetical protein U0L49_02815 [Eubacterium sp.]|nr:hypothetical protein [Eubacterium sp.]